MAEDDIYGNKKRYERWVEHNITQKNVLKKPKDGGLRRYYCKNESNLKYFKKLIRSFEVDDLSYIRRQRLLDFTQLLTFLIDCDLKDVNSIEKEEVILGIRERYSSSQLSKTARDIRRIGKVLFEEEERPKFFKDFSIKVDISRQIARKDKIDYEEFSSLINYFVQDLVMQAYLTIAFETLVRPQELLYTRIRDLEINNKYAYINISSHGKEGVKKLLCIDSYPYLIKMYNNHRNKNNKDAYLFINEYGNQLTPLSINKKIKLGCNKLKIDKPITCYSIKRAGITIRRLQGDDDVTIQRLAGWSSTRQLKTYDQSTQDDVFKIQLAKRGLIKDEKYKEHLPQTKECEYCGELVGFAESMCPRCKRTTDKEEIRSELKQQEELLNKLEIFNKFYKLHKEEFEKILKQ